MGCLVEARQVIGTATQTANSPFALPVQMKEAANGGGLIPSIGRGLDVWSLKTWIDRPHFLVQLILEIGRPLDQDGC
jgi:hypothetical protein